MLSTSSRRTWIVGRPPIGLIAERLQVVPVAGNRAATILAQGHGGDRRLVLKGLVHVHQPRLVESRQVTRHVAPRESGPAPQEGKVRLPTGRGGRENRQPRGLGALRVGLGLIAWRRGGRSFEGVFSVSKPPRRVVAMPAPRMAPKQPVDSQDDSLQHAVLPKRPNCVIRTRRMKPTRAAQVRRQQELVRPHDPDEKKAGKPDQEGPHAAHGRRTAAMH